MSQLVLITGVSSGISAETARRMATEGWQVDRRAGARRALRRGRR
jgi:NADP-dependent 3-hydroxy acid dehydrogenase YdfG